VGDILQLSPDDVGDERMDGVAANVDRTESHS
jgi:hypothetical protein